MRRPTLILTVLLWPASLFADPYVMIDQGEGHWSGTLIGYAPNGDGLFLTCKHKYDLKKPVNLIVNGSVHGEGRIVAVSKDTDLALIQGTHPGRTPPLRIAADSPEIGDTVLMAGHPGSHVVRKTTVVKSSGWVESGDKGWLLHPTEQKGTYKALVLEGSSQGGFSGGAVAHEGKLAGVVVGRNDQTHDAWAVPAESIVWFLRQNEKLFERSAVP